jgi:hypothetical protein
MASSATFTTTISNNFLTARTTNFRFTTLYVEESCEMRETELLNALALSKPGIEIRMCKGHKVSVRMRGEPLVCGIGTTLMEAAIDCAHWVFDVCADRPELEEKIPEVLAALCAYDEHSQGLQL